MFGQFGRAYVPICAGEWGVLGSLGGVGICSGLRYWWSDNALSAAKALRNLMEIGVSMRPLTHMNSQGRVHTRPHTQGKGLSLRMTLMASASRPIPISVT